MKKYLIPTVAVLLVLVVAWTAFGQPQEQGRQRGNRQNMSEEERAKMRERFQNMSEEERDKLRAQMRERMGGSGRGGFTSPEDQGKAIKAIEAQLAKLKAAQITRPQSGFQNLSEAERTKLRVNMQNRQQALQTIIAQVAALQGRRQAPAGGGQGGQFMIINTGDLAPIQAAAKKEKATETTQLIERLITRGSGRGFGGRPGVGQRPEGGQRGTRGQRPEGGQGGRQRPQGGQGGQRQQRNR